MTTTYVIRRERDYFGPRTVTDLVPSERTGEPLQFANRAEAQEWIDQTYDAPYYLSHNESGRPAYKITRADLLPRYLAEMMAA